MRKQTIALSVAASVIAALVLGVSGVSAASGWPIVEVSDSLSLGGAKFDYRITTGYPDGVRMWVGFKATLSAVGYVDLSQGDIIMVIVKSGGVNDGTSKTYYTSHLWFGGQDTIEGLILAKNLYSAEGRVTVRLRVADGGHETWRIAEWKFWCYSPADGVHLVKVAEYTVPIY